MTYRDVMALTPPDFPFTGTTLDYVRRFAPGSRTVTVWYGRIPGYRSRQSWGFALSDGSATECWAQHWTCPRPSARRLYEQRLRPAAEARGFVVRLVVDPESGLGPDLEYSHC